MVKDRSSFDAAYSSDNKVISRITLALGESSNMTLHGTATTRFDKMRLTSGAARVKVRLIESLRGTVFEGDVTKLGAGDYGKAV